MERLRIYLTNEFKYCTLTCTLVRGRNKRVFPPHFKMDLYLGGGGRDSVHCGLYQDTNLHLKKSVVTPYLLALVQRCMVCFSLSDKPKLVSFHPHPQCDCMSKRGNIYTKISLSGNCSVLCRVYVYLHF